MPITCPGCERIFSAGKNLKSHQATCRKYDQYITGIVSQKHALEDRIESSNASAKWARVTASASADAIVNPADEPFLVSKLTLCAVRLPHALHTQYEDEPNPSSIDPNPPPPHPPSLIPLGLALGELFDFLAAVMKTFFLPYLLLLRTYHRHATQTCPLTLKSYRATRWPPPLHLYMMLTILLTNQGPSTCLLMQWEFFVVTLGCRHWTLREILCFRCYVKVAHLILTQCPCQTLSCLLWIPWRVQILGCHLLTIPALSWWLGTTRALQQKLPQRQIA